MQERVLEGRPGSAGGAVVVMGVSGCGKSTVGRLLAARLGVGFAEADDDHPAANVAKMHAGTPLSDADRAPWLAAVAERIAAASSAGHGLVVSCSALRRRYRDVLAAGAPGRVRFVHLVLPEPVAAARVAARAGHFMPAALVASQFAALEPLGPHEPGVEIDAVQPIEAVVARAAAWLARER